MLKLLKIMTYFLFCLIALLLINAVYQYIKEKKLSIIYSPPGELIYVGAHRLHFYCTGSGNKTVLFESGAGMFSLSWSEIQKLSEANFKNVRFCSYDRSGLGWSDSTPHNFSILNEVDDLNKALVKLGIENNIFIVAHSYGGFVTSIFSQKYKEKIKGIILVDSNSLNYFNNNPDIIKKSKYFSYFIKILAPVGLIQLISKFILKNQIPPGELKEQYRFFDLSSSTKSLQSLATSGINFHSTIKIVNNYSIPKEIPIIIISRGLIDKGFGSEKSEFDWREGHRILHKFHPKSKLVIAEKSDHMIHFKQPELIIKSIRNILNYKK